MVEVRQTEQFVRWLAGLRDLRARAKVLARIERLIGGHPGDVKPVGAGVSELRITTALDTGSTTCRGEPP
jgi:putative addiction module killer protein